MANPSPKSKAERLTKPLHLVMLGAVASFASISTKKIGDSIDLRQQAASLRLIELQKSGLVQRAHSGRGLAVRMTDQGLRVVETFLSEASISLERGKKELDFRGTLFTGLNEGAYYISLKGYSRTIVKSLGFEPFPGTLNVPLTPEAHLT